ncbi:MAG: CoA pyrophosphatase [Myxococcota bacterium]
MRESELPGEIAAIKEKLGKLKKPDFRWEGLRKAAVLIPLFYDSQGELSTVFLKRPLSMPTHKGDFAFPGGHIAEGETPKETALREAKEELGIDPREVALLGEMPLTRTLSQFSITPVVGWLEKTPEIKPNPTEVDEVLIARWRDLADPANIEEQSTDLFPERTTIYFIRISGKTVWGATAHIVVKFVRDILAG